MSYTYMYGVSQASFKSVVNAELIIYFYTYLSNLGKKYTTLIRPNTIILTLDDSGAHNCRQFLVRAFLYRQNVRRRYF